MGTKGFKSEKEVSEKMQNILKIWEKDETLKTQTQVRIALGKQGLGHWSKSSISRYFARMEKGYLLIKTKNKNGTLYRPNSARLMTINQVEFLKKTINDSPKYFQSSSRYDVDITMLGLPTKDLTTFEKQCTEALFDEIADAWHFLYKLKMIILNREVNGIQLENLDIAHDMLFRQLLQISPEELRIDQGLSKKLIQEKAFEERDRLGFLVSTSLKFSKEYWQHLENPIIEFIKQTEEIVSKFGFSKRVELVEIIYRITRGILSNNEGAYFIGFQAIRELTVAEKLRFREIPDLLNRYGKEGVDIIIETLYLLKGVTFAENRYVVKQHIVYEKLTQILSKKGLLEEYANSKFGQDN